MLRTTLATVASTIILMISPSGPTQGAQVQPSGIKTANAPIICLVMESFEEGKLGVRAIIFHQRDKGDGPRLGALLLSQSGKEMELEAHGQRYHATVFRIKSCFGRGLALIPTTKLKLGEHDEFTLRMPEKY